jgi:hypothetical protein
MGPPARRYRRQREEPYRAPPLTGAPRAHARGCCVLGAAAPNRTLELRTVSSPTVAASTDRTYVLSIKRLYYRVWRDWWLGQEPAHGPSAMGSGSLRHSTWRAPPKTERLFGRPMLHCTISP